MSQVGMDETDSNQTKWLDAHIHPDHGKLTTVPRLDPSWVIHIGCGAAKSPIRNFISLAHSILCTKLRSKIFCIFCSLEKRSIMKRLCYCPSCTKWIKVTYFVHSWVLSQDDSNGLLNSLNPRVTTENCLLLQKSCGYLVPLDTLVRSVFKTSFKSDFLYSTSGKKLQIS